MKKPHPHKLPTYRHAITRQRAVIAGHKSDVLQRYGVQGMTNTEFERDIENGTLRRINSYFRANDTSHKWPILNKFDATERAIRRLRGQYPNGGLEYFLTLDDEISRIVNGAV